MSMTMQDSKLGRLGPFAYSIFRKVFHGLSSPSPLWRLVENDAIVDDQVAALTLASTLPWMFGKLVLGPLIDRA